jgi:hypothetical protein
MSGKNRAFALAVATAALVGLSAPVASAASFQGSPSGFNGDSVLNVSGNQLPLQACNNDIPINGLLGIQVPLSGLSGALGLLNTAPVTSSADRTCTQTSTQSDATTVNTNSPTTTGGNMGGGNMGGGNMGGGNMGGGDNPSWKGDSSSKGDSSWKGNDNSNSSNDPAGNGTSGFNGDSVLNLSNNQVPVQACNNDIPVNVAGIQVPLTGLSGALGLGSSGAVTSSADRTCTQTPSQTNPTTINTNS